MSTGAERKKAWAPISRNRYISTAPRSEATEEAAYQAELFVARRYGLAPNEVSRGDGRLEAIERGDFVIPREGAPPVIVDVKWTKYETGSLVTWLDARVKADVYILVVGEDSLRIAGWATGAEHRARVGDLGHGERNVTPQALLRQDTDALMARLGYPPVTDGAPRCYTCGRLPVGTFGDGSPRYDPETCLHDLTSATSARLGE